MQSTREDYLTEHGSEAVKEAVGMIERPFESLHYVDMCCEVPWLI